MEVSDSYLSEKQQPSRLSAIPDILLAQAQENDASITRILQAALRLIRSHFDMDIAFISEFRDGRRFFRYIDSKDEESPIQIGGSDPLDESYCQRIVDGRLPELITNARTLPAALELKVTIALPVGAHLSVPIRLNNGRLYGTFCCFSHEPNPTLQEHDLTLMRVFAEFVGKQIEQDVATNQIHDEITEKILAILNTSGIHIAYQPIYCISKDYLIGFEALARFKTTPPQAPNIWFDQAQQVGMIEQLEAFVIYQILQDLPQFPVDISISFNVSPKTILSGAIAYILADTPLDRLILEVTEHEPNR